MKKYLVGLLAALLILGGTWGIAERAEAGDVHRVIRDGVLVRTTTGTWATLNVTVLQVSTVNINVTDTATINILIPTSVNAYQQIGAVDGNDQDSTGWDDIEGDKGTFSEYLVLSGTETVGTANTALSVILFETIISFTDSTSPTENFTLADTGSDISLLKLIVVDSAIVTPCEIVPANLSGATTISMTAEGDSVLLKYVTDSWFVIGGNNYTLE